MFAPVVALSAFLLFLVEPIAAKRLLPAFGGAASVWTTCLVFYQCALLLGYAYANWSVQRLAPRVQAALHAALLAASVAALALGAAGAAAPEAWPPAARVLATLALTIGAPFALLSATGPLVQAWRARLRPGEPYRLYAVSNAASILALVAYPALVEPHLATRAQARWWSVAYALFAVACAWLAWRSARSSIASPPGSPSPPPGGGEGRGEGAAAPQDTPPSLPRRALCLLLSATGSLLLCAVTNHLTQDIASVPLLWLLPLTLYLLTFVLCFDSDRWYRPTLFFAAAIAALAFLGWFLVDERVAYLWWLQIPAFGLGLFVLCMLCHGELVRLRPAPRHLTGYYVTIAAGGALGALAVGLGAPLLLSGYGEMPIGLALAGAVAALASLPTSRRRGAIAGAAALASAAVACHHARSEERESHLSVRNFYGVLRVDDSGEGASAVRRLVHGTILHGEQWRAPSRRREPTTYYRPTSGAGRAITAKERLGPVTLGVVGLGAGTLAAYGRSGDRIRFYELNPAVVAIARSEFTFLSDTPAAVEVALGDARLTLEREAEPRFDVLAVDAFSGDAIPVHLLTREALDAYLRHLRDDGILAFHVSNRFLDLVPVVRGLAASRGLAAAHVEEADRAPGASDDDDEESASDWVLLARDAAVLARAGIRDEGDGADARSPELWTDDFSSLLRVLK
jgi:SAM-dependent methyltransferase